MTHTRRVSEAIVSVFETGRPNGDPSAVVVLEDGAGISYGVHQGTDKSGALDAIVSRYIAEGGALAVELSAYLPHLVENRSITAGARAEWVRDLMDVLRRAGADPIMRQAQDDVFEEGYWLPAVRIAKRLGLVEPLSMAVIYDTTIHSGPAGVDRIRPRFRALPPSRGGAERAWTRAYVIARRDWLNAHPTPAVRRTVYRMAAFLAWIADGRWDLATPLVVPHPRAVIP